MVSSFQQLVLAAYLYPLSHSLAIFGSPLNLSGSMRSSICISFGVTKEGLTDDPCCSGGCCSVCWYGMLGWPIFCCWVWNCWYGMGFCWFTMTWCGGGNRWFWRGFCCCCGGIWPLLGSWLVLGCIYGNLAWVNVEPVDVGWENTVDRTDTCEVTGECIKPIPWVGAGLLPGCSVGSWLLSDISTNSFTNFFVSFSKLHFWMFFKCVFTEFDGGTSM